MRRSFAPVVRLPPVSRYWGASGSPDSWKEGKQGEDSERDSAVRTVIGVRCVHTTYGTGDFHSREIERDTRDGLRLTRRAHLCKAYEYLFITPLSLTLVSVRTH